MQCNDPPHEQGFPSVYCSWFMSCGHGMQGLGLMEMDNLRDWEAKFEYKCALLVLILALVGISHDTTAAPSLTDG